MKRDKDWNPDLYLKYGNERTQPSVDLIGRINISFTPKTILDVGCGPGNSSQALLQRWPDAKLTGIDNSKNMIEKAKMNYPNNTWIIADASLYTPNVKYDIVFSNAAIQWIPDHKNLFKKLFNLINKGGVIAVQIPRADEMPLLKAIEEVADREKWKEYTRDCLQLFTYHDYKYYYELLSADYKSVELWQTDYYHIMESQYSIIEWIRSTGMKPYLENIKAEERPIFENEVLDTIKHYYPVQNNGKVIFPFKRLFMIGYK
jgi:trans-aconitate 2-methyltransferase